MTRNLLLLLASSSSVPAVAQKPAYDARTVTTDEDASELDGEEEAIVVVGQRARGTVVGDIPPENVLDARDIRSTGATSISELLDSVAAQTGSARGRSGGRPILLLNGQRISGFRELRDLPPEAIERMEILPEEVALKYGYAADQRVVNIVLRRRFNSTHVEVGGRIATDGEYASGRAEVGKLTLREGARTSLNARVEGNGSLLESDRDIALQPVASFPDAVDPRPFRTLVGASQLARITATHNRPIFGDVSATITAEAERSQGRSRFGVPTGKLTETDGDNILRAFPGDPLTRETSSNSLGLGFALNTTRGKWRLSSTGNADWSRSLSYAGRGPDLSAIQTQIDAGAVIDPLSNLGPFDDLQRDRGRSTRSSLDLDATATGPLLALPAGEAKATFRLGGSSTDLDSESRRRGLTTNSNPGRDIAEGSVSLDLPIASRDSAIGRLGVNLNAEVSRLSDFGTLTTLGAGVNWSPKSNLNLLASYTREDGPPSLQQLGDPLLETDNVPFFDAKRGETVNVTTTTGGNPALDADRRSVFKLGGNWKPSEKIDLRLRGEFVHQSIDRPQIGFPAATPALEAAFPDRFVRDLDDDTLISVDLRPVNARRSTRDTIRYGFDFTKPLASKRPSPAQIAELRGRFARQNPSAVPPGGTPPTDVPPAVTAPAPAAGADTPGGPRAGGGVGSGGRGGGGMFGGRNGGRLTLSTTHTVTLTDQLEIGPAIEPLDYLDGEALGSTGGRPAHVVEVEGGYYNNGLGVRLTADWRSATRVEGGVTGKDLRFSDYATFDLRLFANLGERFELVSKHPFFRGSSVRLEVNNIFNARPNVRDAAGIMPFAYQSDRLEPIGRTVGINFRKLFLPRRFLGRGGQGQARPQS